MKRMERGHSKGGTSDDLYGSFGAQIIARSLIDNCVWVYLTPASVNQSPRFPYPIIAVTSSDLVKPTKVEILFIRQTSAYKYAVIGMQGVSSLLLSLSPIQEGMSGEGGRGSTMEKGGGILRRRKREKEEGTSSLVGSRASYHPLRNSAIIRSYLVRFLFFFFLSSIFFSLLYANGLFIRGGR